MEHSRSRPAPELSSYIEGYKIGMVRGDDADTVSSQAICRCLSYQEVFSDRSLWLQMRQIAGAPMSGHHSNASMSQFLDDSKHTALPQSFLADTETIPSIAAELAESEISTSGVSSNGGERQRSAADLLFVALDADGDGVITKEEMRKGLSRGTHRSPSSNKRSRAGAGAGAATNGSQSARERLSKCDEAEASGVGLLAKSEGLPLGVSVRALSHTRTASDRPVPPVSPVVYYREDFSEGVPLAHMQRTHMQRNEGVPPEKRWLPPE